mmetsp:Transcript_10683/g.18861  ORF Transcript_10683/g.18861 Transcript_10683/m.18861 type:complete len:218 (-) Transcript_10683:4-657(-)
MLQVLLQVLLKKPLRLPEARATARCTHAVVNKTSRPSPSTDGTSHRMPWTENSTLSLDVTVKLHVLYKSSPVRQNPTQSSSAHPVLVRLPYVLCLPCVLFKVMYQSPLLTADSGNSMLQHSWLVLRTVVNSRRDSSLYSRRSRTPTARSSSLLMKSIFSWAPVVVKVQQMQPTFSNLLLPVVSSVLAPPHSMSTKSTSRRTRRSHVDFRRSMYWSPA